LRIGIFIWATLFVLPNLQIYYKSFYIVRIFSVSKISYMKLASISGTHSIPKSRNTFQTAFKKSDNYSLNDSLFFWGLKLRIKLWMIKKLKMKIWQLLYRREVWQSLSVFVLVEVIQTYLFLKVLAIATLLHRRGVFPYLRPPLWHSPSFKSLLPFPPIFSS
jgi:hypothetical protein